MAKADALFWSTPFLQTQASKFQLLGTDSGPDPFCCPVHLVLYCNLCPFSLPFPLLTFSLLLLQSAEVPRRPVTFSRALATCLSGTVLCLAVFFQHALVFPPQLVIAPHPLAVLLHVWQVWRPNQLHDILEPCTGLTNLAWWASPAVCATRHPGPVASCGAVFERVREASIVACHELVHSLPLKDFEGEAGQGLREAMLSGAADVHAFVLAEETTKQEALLSGHHAVIQLYLSEAEEEYVPIYKLYARENNILLTY